MGKKRRRKRQRQLDMAVAAIRLRYGPKALVKGKPPAAIGGTVAVPHIPTGFPPLDRALGIGGLPKGKISELVGPATSGKTTLALKFLAQAQADGGQVGYIDQARYFDPDYAHRCDLDLSRLPRPVVENLIRAGAMEGFGRARRDLLWELGGLIYPEEGLDIKVLVEPVTLPALGRAERLGWEVELLGLTPGDHVMDLYREALRGQGMHSSKELEGQRDGQMVRVAGLVVVRQRPPTAKGHMFITLEDEEGLVDLIVRPDVYQRYRGVLRGAPLMLVEGRLQREGHALSVLVVRAAALR